MGAIMTAERAPELSAGEEQHQYLTFRIAGESFAIAILGVKEIIEFGPMTTVPMTPAFVRGVINLRGRVVPVVDLALRFGQKATTPGRRTCIVIVEVGQDLGIIVDAVNQVLDIPPADIEPAPSFGAKLRTDFIAGMGKVDGQFVILLNIDRVLSVEEMAMLAQTGTTATEDRPALVQIEPATP